VVFSERLQLKPLVTWARSIDARVPPGRLRVRIGTWMDYRAAGDELARPLESPKDFDWASVQGLHLKGKAWMQQREYGRAQESLEACLKKDPNYLPALADLAAVRYRAMDYRGAWDLARRGLSIDTYDAASNYHYALASVKLGRTVDALDGFEVAAQSPAFRTAALTELAKAHLRGGEREKARDAAEWASSWNGESIEPRNLQTMLARLGGRTTPSSSALSSMPLPQAHFDRFERHLVLHDEPSRRLFLDGIRNEMPHETFLELAAWYHDIGRLEEARELLQMAPQQGEVLYWLAFVQDALRDPASAGTLQKADAASPRLVFPFRAESAPVFEWAIGRTSSWRPKYYLALIHWSRHDLERARELLQQCGMAPDFAPFYAARAKAFETVSRDASLADLERAAELEPSEWRFGKLLVERRIEDKGYREALALAARYSAASPANYILGMLHAKTLILNRQFAEASRLLGRLNVLPYEGSTEARSLYRLAELMVGASEMKAGRFDEAARRVTAARDWPERLGAGKPYPEDVDERLEDWLTAICLERQGRPADARAILARLSSATARPGLGQLLAATALRAAGRAADGEQALSRWAGQQRDARVVEWGRRFYAGEAAAWPGDAPPSDELRILAEWPIR
jgi:tetratricopeptide (TPR) repeat protein